MQMVAKLHAKYFEIGPEGSSVSSLLASSVSQSSRQAVSQSVCQQGFNSLSCSLTTNFEMSRKKTHFFKDDMNIFFPSGFQWSSLT